MEDFTLLRWHSGTQKRIERAKQRDQIDNEARLLWKSIVKTKHQSLTNLAFMRLVPGADRVVRYICIRCISDEFRQAMVRRFWDSPALASNVQAKCCSATNKNVCITRTCVHHWLKALTRHFAILWIGAVYTISFLCHCPCERKPILESVPCTLVQGEDFANFWLKDFNADLDKKKMKPKIPEQLNLLHIRDSLARPSPLQPFPPFVGGGLVHERLRVWVPPPHGSLHQLHRLHCM